jgi:hypothetical protein
MTQNGNNEQEIFFKKFLYTAKYLLYQIPNDFFYVSFVSTLAVLDVFRHMIRSI